MHGTFTLFCTVLLTIVSALPAPDSPAVVPKVLISRIPDICEPGNNGYYCSRRPDEKGGTAVYECNGVSDARHSLVQMCGENTGCCASRTNQLVFGCCDTMVSG
jgi:hypothetical protein